MKISEFISGTWQQQYQYKSFLPNAINHPWEPDEETLLSLIGETRQNLAELNDLFVQIHDPEPFLRDCMLLNRGILSQPCLPLSRQFEMYTGMYFNSLTRARDHNDLKLWLTFFLTAIGNSARNTLDNLKKS